MLIKDISEYFLQNDDNVSCITWVTGITWPLFITQYRRSDLPEFFRYEFDEAETESKMKRSVASLSHIKDYMNESKHNPIKWEELTYNHMTQNTGWVLKLTCVSMQVIKKGKVCWRQLISFEEECEKSLKKWQLFLSRVHPKAVQVQKHTHFWRHLENQKLIGNWETFIRQRWVLKFQIFISIIFMLPWIFPA